MKGSESGVFTNLGKIKAVQELIGGYTKRFNEKLNDMKMADAIDYLEDLRKRCWIIPAAIWVITTIIIWAGAITSLNWAIMAVVLHLVNMANLVATMEINQYLYNLGTRRSDIDPQARVKELWKVRKKGMVQSIISVGASGTLLIAFCVVPYMEFLRLNPTAPGWTVGTFDSVIGSPFLMRLIVWTFPIVSSVLQYRKLTAEEEIYKDVISRSIATKRYHDAELHNVLTGYHQQKNNSKQPEEAPKEVEQKLVDPEPYVVIGKSIRTEEAVELAPVQRKQNGIYFGPVGSGKTSTIFIPQIKQDIDHYLRFVRDFPKLVNSAGFMAQKNNDATHYLNGFAVVETSNDLCQSVYNLAKKMGVPDEKIMWFDPSNPSTPSLNLLRGPVPIVTENVSNIINGVKTENSDFFQQSERTHLKMYITLLKMSAVVECKTPDFSDLMDLYNDIYLVLEKMDYLKQYVAILKKEVEKFEKIKNDNPDDLKARTDYAEMRDKYKVASDCYKWFTNSIKPKTFGQGMLKHKTGDHAGWVIYEDINDQNIAGLRNTLNDLAQNSLLRRILFRESGEFSIDDFLYNGGIMLCNTAKTELQDSLSKTVGQVYMICLATAAFRRKPDTAPMFSIYADEFPDFIYSNFTSFLAQARKYNISIIIAAQTFAQIARDYGQEFAETVMSNMLTRGAFGDLSPGDAKRLEPFFGETYRTVEDVNSQDIDALAGNETNKRSVSSKSGFEPNITASELMQLQKFNIAVRHPDFQGSEVFDIIKTKFLTDDDILQDPNIFDIHDERDEASYETMLANQHHGNPDLDEVDTEIAEKIGSGSIVIAPPDISSYTNPPDPKKKGKEDPTHAPTPKAPSAPLKADDDPDEDPTDPPKPEKPADHDNSEEDEGTREDQNKALEEATKYSSGGNERENNGAEVEESIPTDIDLGDPDGEEDDGGMPDWTSQFGDDAEDEPETDDSNKESESLEETSGETEPAKAEEEPATEELQMDDFEESSDDLEIEDIDSNLEGIEESTEDDEDFSDSDSSEDVVEEEQETLEATTDYNLADVLSQYTAPSGPHIAHDIYEIAQGIMSAQGNTSKSDSYNEQKRLDSLTALSEEARELLQPLAAKAGKMKVKKMLDDGEDVADISQAEQEKAQSWINMVLAKSKVQKFIDDTQAKINSASHDEEEMSQEVADRLSKLYDL